MQFKSRAKPRICFQACICHAGSKTGVADGIVVTTTGASCTASHHLCADKAFYQHGNPAIWLTWDASQDVELMKKVSTQSKVTAYCHFYEPQIVCTCMQAVVHALNTGTGPYLQLHPGPCFNVCQPGLCLPMAMTLNSLYFCRLYISLCLVCTQMSLKAGVSADGEQITVDLEGGMEAVPAKKRKEVSDYLLSLKRLAESALGRR